MIYTDGSVFLLQGRTYGYAIRVLGNGFLQHLYYGGKVSRCDLGLLAAMGDTTAPGDDINMDMAFDGMPGEYGFFAHGDFHDPTAVFVRSDGAAVSRLRYKSYRIYDGTARVVGMPHVRKADKTLEITLKDDFSDVEILLNYTVCDDSDVLVRNAVVKNMGKIAVGVKKAFSFCLDLPNGEYSMMRLAGTWGRERCPETAPIAHGITRLQSLRGASSHQTNPFTAVMRPGCTEESGECFGIQLVYSGSFAITAEWSRNAQLRIQGGINDVGFEWTLNGGEELVTPQALLTYSCGGTGEMSRSIARFLRDRIIDPKYAYSPRPVVVNNWEATYFDFDNEKLFPIIDTAAELGIDTFVLDDGWFGKRDDDRSGLGDWFVNEKKLKGGLNTLIDRCKSRGLKFGLWFEPEMVCEDSDLYRAHPDYAITANGVQPARSRNQLVLDFTRKDVVDRIYTAISKILAENDISYVKWDMNRSITECYSSKLPPERQGEFMHRYILGVYDLAERLTGAFPDVFFEGCAGGGGRFDAGALYYFPQIWTSDVTDGYERTKIQWGTSMCYPLSAMSCHVSVCPNHQTGRTTPLFTRGAVASLGAFGYELDLSKLTEEEKSQVREITRNYKRIQRLILDGDLYRIIDPFTRDYFCEAVVSADKTEAYVVGERVLCIPCDYNRYVYLRGLDPDKVYEIEELGVASSGAALMNVGLLLPKTADFGAWTWHLKAVEK